MKAIKRLVRPTPMALVIAAAGLMPLAASAQSASMAEMQARYKEDMQRCETLTDAERKQTCRREAGAALQEARHNRLATPQANTSANAAQRCERLPGDRRTECERLMRDGSAVTHGSVSGGGVFRELTITVPADGTAGVTGTTSATGTSGANRVSGTTGTATPSSSYGTTGQAAPGGYHSPNAPASTYGSQPAPGSYQAPAPVGGYGAQPAPAPGSYGTQPAR